MNLEEDFILKNEAVNYYLNSSYSNLLELKNLFWIAVANESKNWVEFFEANYVEICKQAFPDLKIKTELLSSNACRQIIQKDYEKYGLLAEIEFENYNYLNTKIHCYFYAETLEELFFQIKEKLKQLYEHF